LFEISNFLIFFQNFKDLSKEIIPELVIKLFFKKIYYMLLIFLLLNKF